MTYPTTPALTQAEAENPGLWDGLVWAYLPGYNKLATIVGADTLSGESDTTIDSYSEGLGETIPLGKFRQGSITPLEGTTAGTIHSYWRMLWTNNGTAAGILSSAPTTSSWSNCGALLLDGSAGYTRSMWRRSNVEAFATSIGTHNSTLNPSVNAVAWRNSTVVGIADALTGERTAAATSMAGAITGTSPVIVGSYYDKSSSRSSNIAYFCGAIWTRDLTESERALLLSDPYAVFRKSAGGDTTAPTLTSPTGTATGATTASGSVSTNEANGTLYYLASANATETDVTVKAASSQAVTTAGEQIVTITGLTAETPYYPHYLHRDAAGNDSAVASGAQFTTSAAGDTTVPTLTGSVNFASITQTSYTAQWPAGSDNVAVTGYEYQIGSTGAWTDAGNNLSAAIAGRTAGTTETVYVRAYDAAGLRSTPAISGSVTLESTPAAGINVTEPLKNNTGTVLASQSGVRVAVLQAADLVSVHEATGLTTNAGGILATISNAAITAGQQYHVAIKLADGSVGITGPITAS